MAGSSTACGACGPQHRQSPKAVPPRSLIASFTLLFVVSWFAAGSAPDATRPTRAAAATVPPEAVAAYSDGRYEEALSLLAAETVALAPEARYLRARALADLGRADQALDTFPETPLSWPERV